MAASTEADAAYYPPYNVVGRLRAGAILTGDIWAAESWLDDLIVCEAKGADLAPALAAQMKSHGTTPQSHSTYRIATVRHFASGGGAKRLGSPGSYKNKGLLRDALVAYAKDFGFTRRG